MSDVLKIAKNTGLTYGQKVVSMAQHAENSITPIELTFSESKLIADNIICTMNEGNTPYRPRYIIVDFEKFMKYGCKFLGLNPPSDIWEATNSLLIFYKHIPSITTMPVYIGNIDKLLDIFIIDEEEAYKAIKLFLVHIDKTITDSFCHSNIGPEETKAGNIILRVAKELNLPTPNITLKYSNKTSSNFAINAINTALLTAKPSFANDSIFRKDFNGDYSIASCYNGLNIGGGSHTLVRVILNNLAKTADSITDFMEKKLPELIENMTSIMDKRVKFIVEESHFFENNFLIEEGFLNLSNFTAMFGIVGLAECVNILIEDKNKRFGHDEEANALGLKIIQTIDKLLNNHKAPYCEGSSNRYLLHAQVGISSDYNTTPGCRIPIGEEPMLYEHILQSADYHKYFPSGIGDIFVFDKMYKNNPEALLDIIKGSFSNGLRYFSLYSNDSDVVRISGYLVKKSEIEKLDNDIAVLRDTTCLGQGARESLNVMNRKVRKL
ncbi:MAG: YjjI family glycine radical enzyme [bacterium]|nr:YjjI family glycine radical enzyme [bacterium]